MSASDPESWARLRLVQGKSSAMTLELGGAPGPNTLTVGQSPGCDWIVQEAGVAPVHFSLHWDGSVLRIADVYGAGGVFVDGVGIGAQWKALGSSSRIEFGRAAIAVQMDVVMPARGRDTVSFVPPVQTKSPSGRPMSVAPGKMTLVGVAPVEGLSAQQAASQEEVGRPRSHMPTLMGISSFPPASNQEPVRVVDAPGGSKPGSQPPESAHEGPQGATLLGIGHGEGAPFAVRRPDSQPPRERPDATPASTSDLPPPSRAVHAAIRNASPTPAGRVPPGQPIPANDVRSAPRDAAPSEPGVRSVRPRSVDPVPQAVLVGRDSDRPLPSDPPPGQAPKHDSQPPYVGSGSEFPSGRPPGLLESQRPKKGFPWRYVGVGLLTALAYGAWLYLLDHL